jgi:non-ribosomal peptide synthetase component E (peptide arylation enzyme)
MRKTVARRHVALCALSLLALTAMLAVGETVTAPAATATHSSAAIGAQLRDDVHAIAVVPARSMDWVVGQQRGPQGNDQLVVALLAGALSVVALARRRAANASHRSRSALGAHRAASRAPPAFA